MSYDLFSELADFMSAEIACVIERVKAEKSLQNDEIRIKEFFKSNLIETAQQCFCRDRDSHS